MGQVLVAQSGHVCRCDKISGRGLWEGFAGGCLDFTCFGLSEEGEELLLRKVVEVGEFDEDVGWAEICGLLGTPSLSL